MPFLLLTQWGVFTFGPFSRRDYVPHVLLSVLRSLYGDILEDFESRLPVKTMVAHELRANVPWNSDCSTSHMTDHFQATPINLDVELVHPN